MAASKFLESIVDQWREGDSIDGPIELVVEFPRLDQLATASFVGDVCDASSIIVSGHRTVSGLMEMSDGSSPLWQTSSGFSVAIDTDRFSELLKLVDGRPDDSVVVRPARIHSAQLNDITQLHGADDPFDDRGNAAPTGRGVLVAVIDSGLDTSHPGFSGRIHPASKSFIDGYAFDADACGHGTHVAGILCGSGPEFVGLAPEAELLVLRVLDDKGKGAREHALAEAIRYATDHGADIINFSGGYAPWTETFKMPPPWIWKMDATEEEFAISQALHAGTLTVVAAGNYGEYGRGTITHPATSPDAISVGSVSKELQLSSFSSMGPVHRSHELGHGEFVLPQDWVTSKIARRKGPKLVAVGGECELGRPCRFEPGVISANSRHAPELDPCVLPSSVHYRKMAGTSQATPIISGLAARAVERLNELYGKPTTRRDKYRRARHLKRILTSAAMPLIVPNAKMTIGHGLPTWPRIERIIRNLPIL